MKGRNCGLILSCLFVSVFLVTGLCVNAEAKPILVGAPASYAAQPWSWSGMKGQQLATKQINDAGGVNVGGVKRPFKLELLDTRAEEAGVPVSEALLGIEKLILEKKVDVLCGGPTMSEASMAVLDLVAKYNIIHLISSGTWTPGWQKKVGSNLEKYRTSFKITSSVIYVIPEGADLLNSIKARRGYDTVYVLTQDNVISRKAAEIFSKLASKKGYKIVGKDVVPQGTTDYSPQLFQAKRKKAKILLVWTNDPTAVILMKQFADLKIPSLMVGFNPAATEEEIWNQVDGKCEYSIQPLGAASNSSSKIPGAAEFQAAYKKFCGKAPFGAASMSYIGMYVLKDAIERAGSLDTDALVDALVKTDYMSINGRVRFNPRNHWAKYSDDPNEGLVSNWFQWIKGKRITVWPRSVADGDIQLPPWMN
ncbi:MAG: ABC transporter substrate-binding protein [Deltaproteobacteria bacterium]|nr:ABC transporter substrate-binding protein [Deltaproteobacteria bacterium]